MIQRYWMIQINRFSVLLAKIKILGDIYLYFTIRDTRTKSDNGQKMSSCSRPSNLSTLKIHFPKWSKGDAIGVSLVQPFPKVEWSKQRSFGSTFPLFEKLIYFFIIIFYLQNQKRSK